MRDNPAGRGTCSGPGRPCSRIWTGWGEHTIDTRFADHVLVPTRWPTDGRPHVLELRLPRDDVDESGASVYLDGALVMSGIPVPRLGGRGTTIVGISGQAAQGTPVRFAVDDFEVFRRMPKAERGAAPR